MNYLIHATPIHPSLCLQYFILLFTIATIITFILLLLLLFHYCHHYKNVATDKPLRASLFPGATELITHLLRLINILWLPLCRINKFGLYFPRRLLRSPILVVIRNPKRRYDEHNSKSSLSCETKVYRTSRRKPNFRRWCLLASWHSGQGRQI
jgi:hypothetical protein